MEWYKKLYVGAGAEDKQRKIISNIRKNKFQYDIFVLTLAINGKDLIDIYPAQELLQEYYRHKNLFIIGIARGRGEAISLVEKIVMDVFKMTGTCDVRDYLKNK